LDGLQKRHRCPIQFVLLTTVLLLVTAVNPSSEEEMNRGVKSKKKVPPYISKAQNRFKVGVFAHSRPFRKAEKKSDNEFSVCTCVWIIVYISFQDLWLSTTYLITEHTFPCIYKRSMVVSKQQIELGPLENAVNSIESKTQELFELVEEFEERAKAGTDINISPLSMAVNGVIDAAVNGGVQKYQEVWVYRMIADHYKGVSDRR
jgi:hypothetical protein